MPSSSDADADQPVRPLRIAVPNKGSLAHASAEILRESGYRQRQDPKELTVTDSSNSAEFFYLRPRDIALYVGEGTLDLGITGRDLLLDSGAKADEVLALGFGRAAFRFAGPAGVFKDIGDIAGLRVATSYPGIVRSFLERRGVEATVTRLDGAVETSIQLGVADVIADVVETGSTLRATGLAAFGEPLLASEAVLITRAGAAPPDGFEVFRRRVEGVLVARTYVMMDYDILDARVDAAVALTPGIESPTVSPLHRDGWVAVRAMVPRAGAQKLMDELYMIGARGILVTDIHACRL
jgi:ATP phosphoribosyltransferase